jgi:hypothetical protein
MSASPELATPVPAVTDVLTDFATSKWLKDSLESALARDPVDALNDALLLASVLEAHLRAALGLAEK